MISPKRTFSNPANYDKIARYIEIILLGFAGDAEVPYAMILVR